MIGALRRLARVGRGEVSGRWGERVARTRLRRTGYRVLGRNVRSSLGEVDLVCEAPDRRTLVIIEVKARRSQRDRSYRPEDALTSTKRSRLAKLAEIETRRRRWAGPVRIDVVAVERDEQGRVDVRHHENAVGAGGRLC
jgi:putative endonuclease